MIPDTLRVRRCRDRVSGNRCKTLGPEIEGLFLAFPAIFPATATLLQKNEKRKKERLSKGGGTRGREAAGLDAAGAAIGGIGLIAFAITVWQTLPSYPLSIVLAGATLVWLITSVRGLWQEIPIGRGSDERQVSVRQQPVSATGLYTLVAGVSSPSVAPTSEQPQYYV